MTTEVELRLPVRGFFGRRGSITSRLAVLYLGSTAVLLCLAEGYLHWGLQQSLARADRAFVSGKLQVLRILLSEQHDKAELLASEIEHEASASELLRYYLRVLDVRGTVLLETSGMSGFLPVSIFPESTPLHAGPPRVVKITVPSGGTYLLLAGEAATGASGGERRTLHIALDVAHSEEFLADYRWKLLAVMAAGLAFAVVAGVLVTRVGLQPIRVITQTTRRITASKLGERVVADQWPEELRELAAAFDEMLDRLQGSFDRLADFSADLAHALRNPINNLRGETEVALSRAREPEEYRQVLGSSLEEHERLSAMIEALLFIARADDPRTAIEQTQMFVRPHLDAVREFYDAVAADQNVTVVCEGDARLVGDPMLVRRAISNLLGNALKHTPGGGVVTMAAHESRVGSVEIVVADTGAGIAAEHLPRVFDRFFQADQTRGSVAKGAGLGLAIVRSIMHLHGGDASIESTVGQGTTVTLRFPAPDDSAKM